MKKWPLFYLFLLQLTFSHAQNRQADSLKALLKAATHDSTRVYIYGLIGENLYLSAPDSALKYWTFGKDLAEKCLAKPGNQKAELISFKKNLAAAYLNSGYVIQQKGNPGEAMSLYNKSLDLRKEVGDRDGEASSLNNIAVLNYSLGDIPKALDGFNKALRIHEDLGNSKSAVLLLNNMASIYTAQGDFSKALEYQRKSSVLAEKTGEKRGLAISLNNMSNIYYKQLNMDSALYYCFQSLKIREAIGDKNGIGTVLGNIGKIYLYKNELSQAIDYLSKSMVIYEELGNKSGLTYNYNFLGQVYYKQGNMAKALDYYTKSMVLSRELKFPENIKNAAEHLSELYRKQNNNKLALENYELFIQMRDSINNQATRKASIKSQLKYEYQKQAAADSVAHAKETEIKNAELLQQKAELRARRNQQYALFGGLALVIVFAGFMYNRFKVTQKQKLIIEEKEKETKRQNEIILHQKHVVEEKQKEILDSITYARRIQKALITNEAYIDKNLRKLRNES